MGKMNSISKLTMEEIDNLCMVFGGHILFQTLHSAIELKLFDLLADEKEMTLIEIAKRLSISVQPAKILLLGLTSTKLLRITNGDSSNPSYSNSRVADIFLTQKSTNSVAQFVKLQKQVMYPAISHLTEAIKTNKNVGLKAFQGNEPTLYKRLSHTPELKKIFQDAMHELSVQANTSLIDAVDLQSFGRIVDIGGGDATNIIQMVQSNKNISGAVFDLPTVEPIAKANIKKHGLSERVSVIPGDCFTDPFPENANCFLFSHFCTIWSPEKNLFLFKKAFEALPKDGHIMIFNQMQNDDASGPLSAAIGSPYFLAIATGEGMLYPWKDYEAWLKETGFSDIQRMELPLSHGLITGKKRA